MVFSSVPIFSVYWGSGLCWEMGDRLVPHSSAQDPEVDYIVLSLLPLCSIGDTVLGAQGYADVQDPIIRPDCGPSVSYPSTVHRIFMSKARMVTPEVHSSVRR